MIRGGYANLRKRVSRYVLRVLKKKKISKMRRKVRQIKHINWLMCYLKKNKQTQWRRGYNNSRLPLLLEKIWYPMKCQFIKFQHKTNYQSSCDVFNIDKKFAANLLQDVWFDHQDLNDFIKKI